MKILITGALGYVGCEALTRFCRRPDITVYAVDNDPVAFRERGAWFKRFSNINLLNADITQQPDLPRVDLIVHLAAKVGYMDCNKDPSLTYKINVDGTKAIADMRTPTVFFSSGSVYGEIGDVCDELVPVNPQTVYATTKYHAEQIIQQVPHVIFRPATAYGLGLKTRHDLLIHDLTRRAVKDKHIDLYQPHARRSFYSVQKLAELIEFCCDHFDQFANKIYNVGCSSGNITKLDIIHLLKQQVEFDCTIVEGQDADTRNYNVHYDKIQSVWPGLDENLLENFPAIVDYYKKW